MLVELGRRQSIEDVITILLGWLLEHSEIFEDLAVDRHLVVEPYTVFTQEVKDDCLWLL